MSETVLVTGGTGYVAGWCIAELLKRGYAVRATVRGAGKGDGVRTAIAKAGVETAALSFADADLLNDAGWEAAMAGCTYVLHVASPLGDGGESTDRDAFVKPAREGTLRVLRAAAKAGVKRVVMTSAAATARAPKGSSKAADETDWSDPEDPRFDAYRRSKILAERAAWDFSATQNTTGLTTILPGAVFGPILTRRAMGSTRVIQAMLHGQPPALAKIALWIVDVRDLAAAHVNAMAAEGAGGQRFLCTGELKWMPEVAALLRERLGTRAANVPTRVLPNIMVRILARFMPRLRMLIAELGRRNEVTADKARRMIGFSPRPAADTIVDCAESLIANGLGPAGLTA